MRMRKKPNTDIRMAKCANLLVADPEMLSGRWLSESPHGELHLEIGCGKGGFTVETAKSAPDILVVALEKSADAQIIAIELAAGEEVPNIKFVTKFADYLPDYFAPGEVSRLYINFCDPWPANRHRKRRLTGRGFVELYKQVICPGGEVHFKTDNLPLFEFSLREFELCGFTAKEVTRDLHGGGIIGVMTDYERKFHEQEMPICRAVFTWDEICNT